MPAADVNALYPEAPAVDTAETVHISALALLKMLKHARAGVPMEVMGLMLGEYVDDYTVRVIDVYSMPQSGNSVSVEAVDPVFQQKMLEMLGQVGRTENCVGWYHSHPGFGCWLSSVDVSTAQSFENSTPQQRGVSVVVDPIQSVTGKVVLSAFRTISTTQSMMGIEPRQTTSNIGWLEKPSPQAMMRGLNRNYYQLPCAYRKNEAEVRMLLKVYTKGWENGLQMSPPEQVKKENLQTVSTMKRLCQEYEKMITSGMDADEVANVGKLNAKHHITAEIENVMNRNVTQVLTTMLDCVVF
ncbi:26S proteasome non-ATPase regulatory subunit 14-like protein [Diplonema papillatum]|nr:26S proteasome non-ATPase regulatory subunit 14-like protein [Diplonema papillatum]